VRGLAGQDRQRTPRDAAFTMRTYVHASDDDLMTGTKTLARIHKIA
jgi:hypothetical protein